MKSQIAILIIGLILGAKNIGGSTGWLAGLLIFGGFFGYIAVFIASGIIRKQYRARFSGALDGIVSPNEFLLFLNVHLRQLSSYFHDCGYLDQCGGLIATTGAVASNALKEANLCYEILGHSSLIRTAPYCKRLWNIIIKTIKL